MSIFDKVYALPSFQRQYTSLLQYSVSSTLPLATESVSKENLLQAIDWNNMLSISSILQQSEKVEHLDAALRIAQSALQAEMPDTQKSAAAVILEGLTNHPAIKLAINRGWL